MAKEEELKRVDLKVNVSCCDGCRRKVMKAMSLKGVLRTEIHPSLDRVTVIGNVDTKVLVKKLAKVGKIAEVEVVAAADKQQKKREGDGDGGKDRDGGSDKTTAAEKSKRKDGGKDMGDKPAAAASSKNNDCHKCAHQQSARGNDAAADYGHGKEPSTKDGAGRSAFEEKHGSFAGGERSAPVNAPAAHQHYHRAEPPSMAVPVHMPYYEPASLTAPSYYAPPNLMAPSYYGPANVAASTYYGGGYYAMPPPVPTMPVPWRPAQHQQQVSRFDVDYFNEDNTAGCRVM